MTEKTVYEKNKAEDKNEIDENLTTCENVSDSRFSSELI